MGVGGVAFRYIMVEAVGWFAYRFQHGRKWWPLVVFLCLLGMFHLLAQMSTWAFLWLVNT